MGRWDADAAQLFGWDEATQARVAARKQAKAHAAGRKHRPPALETAWRETNWRNNPWQYEGDETFLIERYSGESAEGAKTK
jgi:hypothetical protein